MITVETHVIDVVMDYSSNTRSMHLYMFYTDSVQCYTVILYLQWERMLEQSRQI